MTDKIISDTEYLLDLVLFWVLNAKSSPQKTAGFSPFQLVGKNLKLTSTLSDNLPALPTKPSEVLQDKLNALHSARRAFIIFKNDEEIKRALCLYLRSNGEAKYCTKDIYKNVFYKREDKHEWRRPVVIACQVN